jgi:retinol dehydrogenase-14
MREQRESMKGRTCLITGASSGIGKETARALARMGATVVLAGRDAARTGAALEEIRASTGNTDLHLAIADLSSQAEVRRLASECLERFASLHVLVNNAGAMYARRQTTVDGLELTFATNHLAPFLLTRLLRDRLAASAPARVITVSSMAERFGRIAFEDLQSERRYDALRAYGQSKLANVLFTRELARRLDGTGVTANCLHPGAIASNFGRHEPGPWGLLFRLVRPVLATPEQGARTSVYLASSPEVEQVSGRFFVRCREVRASRASRDPELARRLWEVSEQLVGG